MNPDLFREQFDKIAKMIKSPKSAKNLRQFL